MLSTLRSSTPASMLQTLLLACKNMRFSLKIVRKKVIRAYSRRAKLSLGSIGRCKLSTEQSCEVRPASAKKAFRALKINEPLILDPQSGTRAMHNSASWSPPDHAHRGDMRANFFLKLFWKKITIVRAKKRFHSHC